MTGHRLDAAEDGAAVTMLNENLSTFEKALTKLKKEAYMRKLECLMEGLKDETAKEKIRLLFEAS